MSDDTFLIGSHVSMNGKDMFLGSAKKLPHMVRMFLWFTRELLKIPFENRLKIKC